MYKLCEKFPRSELYGLTDQLNGRAVSVSSNIAKVRLVSTWANSCSFYPWPMPPLLELDTQRIIATNMNLIDLEASQSFDRDITEIRKMLYVLRARLKKEMKN